MAHIIVNDVSPTEQYTATAGQVNFTISWPFFTNASLNVYLTPSGQSPDDAADLLTLTTNYTVTGAGNVAGVLKRITLQVGASVGDIITIRRNEPTQRITDIQEQGDFLSVTYNDEQDLVIMLLQQVEELLGRTITKGITGGDWNAESIAIKNVSDPVDGQDAVTKNYLALANPSYFAAVSVQNITNLSATNKTLALSDSNTLIESNRTSLFSVVVPENSSVAFPIGTIINFSNRGTSQINISQISGTVGLYFYDGINQPSAAAKKVMKGGVATLQKIATDTWAVYGNTAVLNL